MSAGKGSPGLPPGLTSNATSFVPGGASSSSGALAKAFVPSAPGLNPPQQGGSSRNPSLDAPSFIPGIKPLVFDTPASAAGAPAAAQGGGGGGQTNNNTEFGLPEDDDILGLSSSASAAQAAPSAKELATQAAQMFRSMRPFQPAPPSGLPNPPPQQLQQQHHTNNNNNQGGRNFHMSGGPPGNGIGPPPGMQLGGMNMNMNAVRGGGGGRGGGFGMNMNNMNNPPPPSMVGGPPGRGFNPQQQQHQQNQQQQQGGQRLPPPTAAAAAAQGSTFYPAPGGGGGRGGMVAPTRGRGRGRGRGPPIGPGANRPFIAAYALTPGRMQLAGQFIPETLRQDMQQRSYLSSCQMDSDALVAAGLPTTLEQYHSLWPLEDRGVAAEAASSALGVCSLVLKGIHAGDGAAYALRRIDGRQVVPTAEILESAEAAVERWSPVANHPNIVGLREVFVSDEIDGTPSLYFSYDFHPGAYTLEQAHVMPTHTDQGLARSAATEEQLWSYLVQLTGALRAVHSAGLVAGAAALSPSKVLLVAPSRVRLGAVGLSEALAEAPPADVPRGQREDLACVGSLLLVLACAARNAPPALDTLAAHYSRELCHVVAGLLASAEGSGFASWRSLVATLGDRVFGELEASSTAADTLAGELQKECENGRLVRLLMKLNFVNDRPELMGDSRWAETGDRYLLKLFRDFVFHQVEESGAPSVEWGAAIEALNKADAGFDEKIVLLSRDEASMLVISYADVRRCLQAAYDELKAAGGKGGGGRGAKEYSARGGTS